MNTRSLATNFPLHRPWTTRLVEGLLLALHAVLRGWRARAARRAERRALLRADRELARIDLRTLQDIGAPQGVLGQRRWQEEHEAAELDRLLNQRGW